jgi:hypothetical protein
MEFVCKESLIENAPREAVRQIKDVIAEHLPAYTGRGKREIPSVEEYEERPKVRCPQ